MKLVPRFPKNVTAGLLLCLLIGLAAPGQERKEHAHYHSPGTKRMAERLARIYREQDFRTDPSKDRERVEYYRAGLKLNLDIHTEVKARLALADSLLKAGESAAAVGEVEALRRRIEEKGLVTEPAFAREMRQLLAVAYLRQGEQENCLLNHNRESCIYPIRLGGRHQLTRGSAGAVREFSALLREDSRDHSARWLLNLAHMTLGEHPQKVPSEWLIPTARFDSEYDIKRFTDVAPALGLDVTGHAGGSLMEDFDRDGLLDLMMSSSGPLDQLRFFRNRGDGTFTERTKEAGLTGVTGGLNLIHGDYNNDNWPDALVLRGGWWAEHGKYPPSLLRNNGDGTFDDVTEEAGLLSYHPTQTAAWADYDGDGWLDLYLGHENNVRERHPSELYHNNRDGTFTEVGAKLGLAEMGYVKGVAWGDFNNDGRPDLYVSRKGEANKLFRNDGPKDPQQPDARAWKFTDVTARAGVKEPVHSFATWFWDYDNDGWQDLFVNGYYAETMNDIGAFLMGLPYRAEVPRLYRNRGDGTFEDVTKKAKLDRVILPMGANYGDLDNDGWLDCYFGTGTPQFEALLPNKMFRNAGGQTFQDVTTSGGFGHLQKGHGVSFGDLDHDGDQDVFEVVGGALAGDTYQSVLFENPGHGGRWLTLELTGTRENRAAIGVRVRVRVETKDGARDIHRTVSSGGSFGGSPFRLHVGLGDAAAVREIEIRWPVSGKTQLIRDGLSLDRHYRLREGESQLTAVELKRFALSGKSKTEPHHHH